MPSRPHLRRRRWTRALALAAASASPLVCTLAATASAHAAGGLADQTMRLQARDAHERSAASGRLGRAGRAGRAPRRARDRREPRSGRHAARAAKSAKRSPPPLALIDLRHMTDRGAIAPAELQHDRHIYMQALHTLPHLQTTRRAELAAVMNNVQEMAAAKDFTPTRLPELFMTLQRNLEWWTTKPLLSYGQRVTFPGSRLIWEYYPGEGIELQWLATFGEANGYYLAGDRPEALRQVLEEAEELAVDRAGGLAWEYLFHFDGGAPPWTSGLSQGTAIQAFARASSSLGEPGFAEEATRGLGVFQTSPPEGVRVATGAGAHYLEYSFAPRERILNGFIQAITGLYDFAKLTGSRLGAHLFEEGDAQARLEVPSYDTGAWSMYDQHTESDLGYHRLLTEFLHNLCERTREGPPLPPEGGPAGQATGGTPEGQTGSAPEGQAPAAPGVDASTQQATGPGGEGEPATGQAGHGASALEGAAIPGDEIYCSTAERFEAYLHTPPVIKLLSHRFHTGVRAGVRYSLSKISTISLTVRRRNKVIWTNKATVESGNPRLLWITPRQPGVYRLSATATDLAGNLSSASGTVRLTLARKPRHGAHAHPTKAGRRDRGSTTRHAG